MYVYLELVWAELWSRCIGKFAEFVLGIPVMSWKHYYLDNYLISEIGQCGISAREAVASAVGRRGEIDDTKARYSMTR
jgi:hypothetical protein